MIRFLVFLSVKTTTVIFPKVDSKPENFTHCPSLPLSGQMVSIVSKLFNLNSGFTIDYQKPAC